MKKLLPYILILVALVGVLSSINGKKVEAACSITPITTESACKNAGGTWTPELAPPPSSSNYKLLAPLPNMVGDSFDPGEKTALGTYLNLLIKAIIGISAVLAVLMISMGGIEYMGSELISSKEAGKDKIQNAIFGLLIALGAFALLNTINPDLLQSDVEIENTVVTVVLDDDVPQTYNPATGMYKNGILRNTPLFGTPTPLPPGVTLNNNGKQCTQVGQTGCTSTIGLNVDKVWDIKNGCKCNLVITGGTEWWEHGGKSGNTTHQQGNGTIDLRSKDNPELNKYFKSGKPLGKGWYQTPAGYALDEGDHWHFNPVGPH